MLHCLQLCVKADILLADVDIDDISSAGEEIPYSTPVKANSPKENGNDTNAVGETQTEPEDDDADEDDDEGEE